MPKKKKPKGPRQIYVERCESDQPGEVIFVLLPEDLQPMTDQEIVDAITDALLYQSGTVYKSDPEELKN